MNNIERAYWYWHAQTLLAWPYELDGSWGQGHYFGWTNGDSESSDTYFAGYFDSRPWD